jgi:phospholipid/cholesterol/gamma-HCH transport system substrate-binding protein
VSDLLKHTADVTTILSQRSDQVNTMILNANDLTGVLAQRRHAIIELLAGTSALAQNLAGLIADNESELAPTLDKLNAVTGVLVKNRDNLAKALPGLAKYESGLSEIVASGPYYTGYIPNLTQGVLLQPFLDYAFGFRRGTTPGPDNAGPRAEPPVPRNGIPQQPQGGGR